MKNRLTFPNVIGILLDNKKKTYQQHQLIRSLFSLTLNDGEKVGITDADNIKYSNWCNGVRPIPLDIIRIYEEDHNFDFMRDDIRDKIIPNLINESQARSMMEGLINDSRDVIGSQKAGALLSLSQLDEFFTEAIRYAILNNHSSGTLYSPDLSDVLLSSKLPSVAKVFYGRKSELKEVQSLLQEHSLLFVTGIAGIGKSEFGKMYAAKNRKRYTNILYIHYDRSLTKSITGLSFAEDSSDMTDEQLFQSHYQILQKLRSDSLIILDNFNVLPKEDPFFKEFIRNDFQILITTRCKVSAFQFIELKELDPEKELMALFCDYCPAAKKHLPIIADIISELNGHTLTVCLAALSLTASGIEPEELLYELRSCGLNIRSGETIEFYKDEEFTEALMIEHLKKLLQLNHLNPTQIDILRNLSLMPASGVLKNSFSRWLELCNLNEINQLVRYGLSTDDEENKKINLHPLIQDVAVLETMPSISNCKTLMNSLYVICLAHGLEVKRPDNVIQAMISYIERVIVDEPSGYLLFLQDMFPFLDKYLVVDYMPKLVDRIAYIMEKHKYDAPHDTLQQLINLTNMLILAKEYDPANQVLSFYEYLILEYSSTESFDYGICQLGKGIIELAQNDPVKAEIHLLKAENRMSTMMEYDNGYSTTCYRYLYSLYSRWHKQEKAIEYREKLLAIL